MDTDVEVRLTSPATTHLVATGKVDASAQDPVLVSPDISRRKLGEELAHWDANTDAYRSRGWLLLDADLDNLRVDLGFLAIAAIGDMQVPIMTACVRLRYNNYDLWPPSLTFIDPRTGEPTNPPVQAPARINANEVRNALLGYPVTGAPFLCLPGNREYHNHPQHTGDDWLLHRAAGEGRLAVIAERIWQRMVRNVIGLQVVLQSIPTLGTQLQVALAQGDVDLLPAGP